MSIIETLAGAILGSKVDDHSYRSRSEYDWNMAQSRGLTPQEFYGSPAAGGSAGVAGSSLGNSLSSQAMARRQLGFQASENEKDRQNKKDIAEIQAGATRYSSDQSSGASRYSTQIQQLIAGNRLKFDEQVYKTISLPGAQAELNLTKKQTEKVVNEIATTDPKFLKAMKLLSMGTENMVATMVANSSGIDVTDPKQLMKLTERERSTLLATMIAAGGHTRKEMEGLMELVKGLFMNTENPSYPDGHPALGNGEETTVWDTPFFSIKKH